MLNVADVKINVFISPNLLFKFYLSKNISNAILSMSFGA